MNKFADLAGWDTARITFVLDAGNLDNQTNNTGNDADARLYVGDLTPFTSRTTNPIDVIAVTNGGIIDDVTTVGAPLVLGDDNGVGFGDTVITRPSNIDQIVEMRVLGGGDPLDISSQSGVNAGAYTLGDWIPAGAGQRITIAYVLTQADSSGFLVEESGGYTYEFKYSDGSIVSQLMQLVARNSDGTPPP